MGIVVAFNNLGCTPFQEKVQQSLLVIRPDYTITGFLGEGSFGVVYEIENSAHDILCLKVLATPGSQKPKVLRAVETLGVSGILEREKYPQQLQHPNIVDVIESISIEIGDIEIPCVVQKKIEGPTLEAFLRSTDTSERLQCLAAITQGIAAGVGHLHSYGIAHRDLKLDNIKIAAGDIPRIFDFSIAERIDAHGNTCNQTPADPSNKYSAPEVQAKEHFIDERRADVWSLGLILYEYITGTNPQKESALQFQEQLLPRRYRTLIQRCLETAPKKRYQDGNAVYNALRQAEWYYARKAAVVIGIPILAAALLTTPLGIDIVRLRTLNAYTTQCTAALEHSELEEASYSCKKALALDPKSCVASVKLGHILFLEGKEEEAKTAYTAAQQFCSDGQPNDIDLSVPSAMHELALELNDKGEKKKAITLLRLLKEVAPNMNDAYSRTLLDILMDEKDYAQATSIFADMKNTENVSATYFYELGLWHHEQQHLDTALLFAKGAVEKEREPIKKIKKNPTQHLLGVAANRGEATDDLANALFLLGDVHFAQQSYDSAFSAYKEANSIRPDRPDVFVNIAAIWMENENYVGAKEILERAEKMYLHKIAITVNWRVIMIEKGDLAKDTDKDLLALYMALDTVYEKMDVVASHQGSSSTSIKKKMKAVEKEIKKYEPVIKYNAEQ